MVPANTDACYMWSSALRFLGGKSHYSVSCSALCMRTFRQSITGSLRMSVLNPIVYYLSIPSKDLSILYPCQTRYL